MSIRKQLKVVIRSEGLKREKSQNISIQFIKIVSKMNVLERFCRKLGPIIVNLVPMLFGPQNFGLAPKNLVPWRPGAKFYARMDFTIPKIGILNFL